MFNVSKRFRKYSAQLAAHCQGSEFEFVTRVGHWQSHRAGRRGRLWVTGYCLHLALEAVLYPRHARRPGIELEDSYIRKLCLRRMVDARIVAFFDRGWRLPPSTQHARRATVYFMKWTAFLEYGPYAIRRGEEPIFLGGATDFGDVDDTD